MKVPVSLTGTKYFVQIERRRANKAAKQMWTEMKKVSPNWEWWVITVHEMELPFYELLFVQIPNVSP